MIHFYKRFSQSGRLLRRATAALSAFATAAVLTGNMQATPVPANLGNGLGKLVESDLAITSARASGHPFTNALQVNGKPYADAQAAAFAANSLSDDQGRLLVRITLSGKTSFKETKKAIKAAASTLSITAIDKSYRGVGILNAYVDVSEAAALSKVPGVSAVLLELKPYHKRVNTEGLAAISSPNATVGETLTKLGTAFDQGVTQHRVDQINKFYNPSATLDYQGQGMQIGFLSDSYDTRALLATPAPRAPADVTNFDLPGSATNPAGNTQPVVVLQDLPGGSDEGRAMVQIGYKMAPKARLAFASADYGEVGFANNIRALAGIPNYTFPAATQQGFAADTICDDVGYFDEPYFQDGIIGSGVDDASAAGVAYFSSAANDIGVNGYDSDLRFVPNGTGLTAATNTALVGTNLDLTNVPTNLYAGGFHNFNPNGLDVAQTVNIASNANEPDTVLQWNEPYDQTSVPNNLVTVYTASGTYTVAAAGTTGDQTFSVSASLVAGTIYVLDETAAAGSSFDGVVTIKDPNGNVLINALDNSGDESARFVAPVSGTGYTVVIGHYSTTTGAFNLKLSSSTGYTGNIVQSQIYLLAFTTAGVYVPGSSLVTNPLATNQPLQLGFTLRATGSGSQLQYVIARGNTPTGPNVATHVRYLIPGNGLGGVGPAEYFTYNTVTTGGHAMAATCNGCAAYNAFRPALPETFSSPGPVTVYYDKMNNRLATPDVRLQPRMGFLDNGNTSFFSGDVNTDPDTNPNFSGTSAAGPHGAAIAALVLEAKGGRRSVTPAQMTSLLQRSTFPHDLDPNFASGTAKVSTGGKVTITISSDGSANAGTGTNDNNAFTINYVGGSSVTSFVFNPGGTAATAGNSTGGNNGVTYSATGAFVGGTATYFENSLPGAAFFPGTKAFTLGTGITGATAVPTNLSGGTNQYYTLTITIPSGNLSGGNVLRFGIGRGVARTATTGGVATAVTSSITGASFPVADIFGGGVSLPNGVIGTGMTFNGTTADGGTFSGVIKNNIGAGYSPLDGFGFVNAEAAVSQTVQ